MKVLLSVLFLVACASPAAFAKTCKWSGGNDSEKAAQFDLLVTQKTLEISNSTSQDFSLNGTWKFKREFKAKDKTTWLEYRFPKDKAAQAIVDPQLLRAKGTGTVKLWYNNGDGFLSTIFACE